MKVAWFQGDVEQPRDEDVNPPPAHSLAQLLALPREHPWAPHLRVLLIPDDADARDLWGDDWDDAPADCNAGPPYAASLPAGAKWLTLAVGDPWPASVGAPDE